MIKRKITAGIVGSGFAAKFHYEAIQHVSSADVGVAGAYSLHAQHLRVFAQPRQLEELKSLEALLEASDVIHVCTPPVSHEEIVVAALKKNKHVIVEKPITGFFGDGSETFNGDTFSRETGLNHTLGSLERMLAAEKGSTGRILYAENWIYAPAVQKEREVLEKTGAQILWMQGEQCHSGSHSPHLWSMEVLRWRVIDW